MKKYKKQDEKSYTLGITLTFELLHHKINQANKIYIHSSFIMNETYQKLTQLCESNHIPIEVNDKVFNVLSEKENCYVIGEFTKFTSPIDYKKPHIVLVNPSNAGNLGTIIRTSVGFGINNLVIIQPAVDIFDPKVIRASMGALFTLNFTYFDNFSEYQKKTEKRDLFPFMLKGSISLKDIHINGLYSLIFGNEATGLPEEFSQIGQSVRIVHLNTIDSLNLPNAVSIALYESTKNNF